MLCYKQQWSCVVDMFLSGPQCKWKKGHRRFWVVAQGRASQEAGPLLAHQPGKHKSSAFVWLGFLYLVWAAEQGAYPALSQAISAHRIPGGFTAGCSP